MKSPPASRKGELHLLSLAGYLLAEARARNISALMVFIFEDDGFARLSRLRVRGNENTILGMGLHGTLSTRKGTPRYRHGHPVSGRPCACACWPA